MGIMEKKMETTIAYWGCTGTMEKTMEATRRDYQSNEVLIPVYAKFPRNTGGGRVDVRSVGLQRGEGKHAFYLHCRPLLT